MCDMNSVTHVENNRIIDFNNREFIYTGEMKNGMANGYGKGVYTGMYLNSNEDLVYLELYQNNTYEGEWENNRANGYGKFYGDKNHFYEGSWSNGKNNGFGISQMGDDLYIGYFIHGVRHGRGINKNLYRTTEANYVWGKKEGKGKLIVNEKEYEVEFKSDKVYNGYTKILNYEGYMKNGKRDGYGTYIDYNHIYTGMHKKNKFHGKGVLKSKTYREEGEWCNGLLFEGITEYKKRYTINGYAIFEGKLLDEKRKDLEKNKLLVVMEKLTEDQKLSLGNKGDISEMLKSIGY